MTVNPASPASLPGQPPASGFTLLEVVLVSAVLVILLVTSAPRFAQTAQRLRAEQTAFALIQSLRYAREQAIFQGRSVVWAVDDASRRVELYAFAAAPDGSFSGQRLSGRAATYGPLSPEFSIQLRREEQPLSCAAGAIIECGECQCVQFFADGTGESAQLQLQLGGLVYTVAIDAATGSSLLTRGPATR